jgi:WD40 repeat protein
MAENEMSGDFGGLDDSDDDFVYEEVEIDEVPEELEEEEDLESALMRVRLQAATENQASAPRPVVGKRAELVDDFIRNFLLKMKMTKTMDCFQTEWYEKSTAGELTPEDLSVVADVYQRNQDLDNQVKALRAELDKAKEIAHKARSTWDKFRKERDFHRMNHRRVVQEKSKLVKDLRRLREHLATYEPTLKGLEDKYRIAMKEKAMAKLQADRLQARVETVESQLRQATLAAGVGKGEISMGSLGSPGGSQERSLRERKLQESQIEMPRATKKKVPGPLTMGGKTGLASDTSLTAFQDRENPYLNLQFEPQRADKYELRKTYKAHIAPISALALHPKKSIVATASDDHTWKMWSIPNGDLILTGEGHKSWVSCIDFHPKAATLATSSGDCTVKLWDFAKSKCVATLSEHAQAVWGVAYHDSGDFVASCSMDHTAKVWDVERAKCRGTLRGHVDSINAVIFQPFSNNICTCAGDKTVSLWDARTGLCIQTFYGHLNSCNHVAFNLRGDTIASTDADGGVRLWDVRMVQERLTIDAGPGGANKCALDRSGTVLAVASEDHSVKLFDANDGSFLSTLDGHEEAVQAVAFDAIGNMLISSGSDNTFRVWS